MTLSSLPASVDSSTWKSSMTISADRQAERWRGPGSTAWSHGSALAKSVRSYASTRRGRSHDELRMDADSLSPCHCDSKESILRGGLRLRKEREAHLHRRRQGAAKLRT